MKSLACEAKRSFPTMSRETAREVGSISAGVLYSAGMERGGKGAAVR